MKNKKKKNQNPDISVDAYKEYHILVNYTDEPVDVNHVEEGIKDNVLAIPSKSGTKGKRYLLEAMKKDVKIHAIVYEKALKGYVASFESHGRAYISDSEVFTTNNVENYKLRIRGTTAYAPHNIVTRKEIKAKFPDFNFMRSGTAQQLPKKVFDWISGRLLC